MTVYLFLIFGIFLRAQQSCEKMLVWKDFGVHEVSFVLHLKCRETGESCRWSDIRHLELVPNTACQERESVGSHMLCLWAIVDMCDVSFEQPVQQGSGRQTNNQHKRAECHSGSDRN